MKLLSVFLIAGVILFANCLKCPKLGKKCKNDGPCEKKERCYRDLDGTPNATKSYCCSISCSATNMFTFHSSINTVYSHKWNDKLNGKLFYKDKNTSIACPIPHSLTTINTRYDLPVDFSETGTNVLKTCKTNEECGDGFYCGSSVNPSFQDEKIPLEIRKSTKDRSNDGEAMKFCYPIPQIDKRFEVALVASEVGLPLCNTDSECVKSGAICFFFGSLIGEDGKTAVGFCVQAYICNIDHPSSLPLALLTTKGEFCSTSADCGGIKDDSYMAKCVSLFSVLPMIGQSTATPLSTDQASSTGAPLSTVRTLTTEGPSTERSLAPYVDRSMCCLRQRTCARGTAQSPLMLCKSNSDCNKGGWCDESGICCYDPSAKQLDIYCPGGLILAQKEPACNGHCQNGKCINGRCCPIYGMDNNIPLLGIIPYITHTPCKPNEQLPAHALFIYCPPSGFYTVIGTHDIEGKPLMLEEKTTECETNDDCTDPKKPNCLRVSGSKSKCIRDPFKKSSSFVDSLYTIIFYILIVVACIGAVVLFIIFWKIRERIWMVILRRIYECRPRLAEKIVNKKKAIENMEVAIYNSANEIAAMFEPDEEQFDGEMPEFTFEIAQLYALVGWLKMSVIFEVRGYVAKAHYEYAIQFLIKYDRMKGFLTLMARIHAKPVIRTPISREVTIRDIDLIRGITPKMMIILKNVYHDEDKDENRDLSNGDSIQTEPSTESSSKSKSLEVEKTQSDRSNRKRAGANRQRLFSRKHNVKQQRLANSNLSIPMPSPGSPHVLPKLPWFLQGNDNVDPYFAGEYERVPVWDVGNCQNVVELESGYHNPYFMGRFGRKDAFIVFENEEEAYAALNMEDIEESQLGHEMNVFAEMLCNFRNECNVSQRVDAGGEKEENTKKSTTAKKVKKTKKKNVHQKKIDKLVKSFSDKGIPDPTNEEKFNIVKGELAKPQTDKKPVQLYQQLVSAYHVKMKKMLGKELEVLNEALKDINKALDTYRNNLTLLEQLAYIKFSICKYKPSEENRIQSVMVLEKLMQQFQDDEYYLYAHANFAYPHIILTRYQRYIIFGEPYKPDISAVNDLLRAEKIKPSQLRNFLLLAKIEIARKNTKKAREYLKKAEELEPFYKIESGLKTQAIELYRKYK